MSEVGLLVLLYTAGVLILVAEIFIPSHGILTVAGLGFLVAAVSKTFSYGGREAGMMAVVACMIFVPTLGFFAIKYWHLTPIGKRIAPPNPKLTAADTSVPIEELARYVGRTGRSVSPLRPVGICEFDGRRFSCVAEFGLVEAGVDVKAIAIKGSNLAVVEKTA